MICKWCKRPIEFHDEIDKWLHSNGSLGCGPRTRRRVAEPPSAVSGLRVFKWAIVGAVAIAVVVASFLALRESPCEAELRRIETRTQQLADHPASGIAELAGRTRELEELQARSEVLAREC
jgi:hypothetical protein